ncbi:MULTISPECIES: DUF2938 domain-containing protein [Commensalibacter]|uniref:Transmembrane protein n=2 Tax=Commensalibacter TaxID=1079922 RepID=W7E260_9PROT|nr:MULTISPECIES: DUF2938 domain-containing protein [Commensalibacter]EUK19134.1 hypothetical protein COMX_05270 [Commensalibacter papalotli (ex Servin-Garciduenas et al. 2014)]CAI3930005.1 unnamed protein product [Commensalibacter papalotli (ex Botero et al. 2024)]CAI3948616.1 unnamed protein product [Commensalibacter papalotli (ex Botero et al. 2024)]
MMSLMIDGILIGVGATVMMDIWDIVFGSLPGQSKSNWAPVGRWVWHLKEGIVFHQNIDDAKPYEHELALGWIFHYIVGILYGVLFALYVGTGWFAYPTFLPTWVWGMITIGAGWFLLQPGLGIGVAASQLSNAWTVRILNIVAHSFFALGMYGTALLLR